MMRVINPDLLYAPSGYSHGILMPRGSLLFIAGQVAWDRHGRIVSGSFVEQFDQALANVVAVVVEAGGSPTAIAKLTMFVTDKNEYSLQLEEIGAAYRRRMGRHFPAMTLVEVKALLEPGARVEIEGMAVLGTS